MKNALVTYNWNFKDFTNQQRLVELAGAGKIKMVKTPSGDNGFNYGSWYRFETLDGQFIAKFYKDNSFGYCTQACGIELPKGISI